MQGFTKEELIQQLDEIISEECSFITHIATQGEYIYLKYNIYSDDGLEEVEEHIRPENHDTGVDATMFIRKTV